MKTSTLAAVIAGAIALPAVTIGGAFAYNAYQHEQECKGYEEKVSVLVDEMNKVGEQALEYATMVEENPFAFLVVAESAGWTVGRMMRLTADGETLTKDFQKTCGAARYDRFVSSPNMSAKLTTLEHLKEKANKLIP